MKKEWGTDLNEEQLLAATHENGPLLILAGAGSGKTTVLVSRTGRLITETNVKPKEICVLTFTNKAARELRTRVSHSVGKSGDNIWAGTFHSFGLSLIKENREKFELPKQFGIADTSDVASIFRDALSNLNQSGKTKYDYSKFTSLLSVWRESGRTTAINDEEYEIALEWALPRYNQRKKELGLVDFEDLLYLPIQLFKENPEILKKYQNRFKQMMVDEFQDTNLIQMKLIDMLVENHRNITVVGDDDQSIYGWRGAKIENILNFPKRYRGCKVVKLEKNYRSRPEIIDLANAIISKNSSRHSKKLLPIKLSEQVKPEIFVYEDENIEVERVVREIQSKISNGVRPSEIAVIYRSNSQGAFIESELRNQRVPYKLKGGNGFFDQKEVKDALAYLKSAFYPNDLAIRRIINYPSRGIGQQTLLHLEEISKSKEISLFRSIREAVGYQELHQISEKLNGFLQSLSQIKNAILTGAREGGDEFVGALYSLGVRSEIDKISKDHENAAKRWRSVQTLGNILNKFILNGARAPKTIREFLEAMALRDSESDDDPKDEVQLLTLHAAKGLEYPHVILLGLEEDILPHRSLGEDINEERRLFYVGVTRAKDNLMITRCRNRRRNGKIRPSSPSRFLLEIEKDLFVEHDGDRPITEGERSTRLSDLFQQFDKKIDNFDAN